MSTRVTLETLFDKGYRSKRYGNRLVIFKNGKRIKQFSISATYEGFSRWYDKFTAWIKKENEEVNNANQTKHI